MPETSDDKKPSKIDTAGKTLLDSVSSWVKSQGPKQAERGAPGKWVTGAIIAVIAMLAIGFFYFRAWQKGKELAKLKHERDVAKQELERKKVDDVITEREKTQALKWVRVREAEDKLKAIDVALKVVEDRKAKTDAEIDDLRDWNDVDRFLNRDR